MLKFSTAFNSLWITEEKAFGDQELKTGTMGYQVAVIPVCFRDVDQHQRTLQDIEMYHRRYLNSLKDKQITVSVFPPNIAAQDILNIPPTRRQVTLLTQSMSNSQTDVA